MSSGAVVWFSPSAKTLIPAIIKSTAAGAGGSDRRPSSVSPAHRAAGPTRKAPLDPLSALWHLLNLFAPAAGLGLFASALAKLVWRPALKHASWLRLWAVGSGCAALAMLGGLIAGHDGRLATYGVMVVAAALGLWWVGFRPFRKSA